jgi:hypothetical protein
MKSYKNIGINMQLQFSQKKYLFSIVIVVTLFCITPLFAQTGNIDETEKYAWGTNIGWVNFCPQHGGVTVYSDHLEGYAWAENIGWIRLGTHTSGSPHTYENDNQLDYGVNHDGAGNLSGYAWSTNAGWINFNPTHSQVTINMTTGSFDGYAWSENIGWIHFKNTSPEYNVVCTDPGTLPVILSTFTADFINNTPTIYWETQSEVDNMGWNVYRNVQENFSTSALLTEFMIPGHGTTTEPSYYNFEDGIQYPEVGSVYYYWLESIDYSGISQVYSRVAQITVPDPSVNPPNIEPPLVYDFKNVPNPVNSSAHFQFTLDKSSMVSVSIYNILGELVKTLPPVMSQPDETAHIFWNGKDSNGKKLTSGVYFYNLFVNGKTTETKKLILMK